MLELVHGYEDIIRENLGVVTPGTLAISHDGNIVGTINYQIGKFSTHIAYVTIFDEYKRQGLASKVIDMIKQESEGKPICGDSLPGALEFWASMGAEFYEDPEDDYLTPFKINCYSW